MQSEAIAALFGALIGAAGPIIANVIHERRQEARRARQVSLAVAGEIAAVAEIVRRRNYLTLIRQAEADGRAGNLYFLKVKITHDYFPVLEATIGDLGILPDGLSSLIPRFLTLAKSVLEDFQAIEQGYWGERGVLAICESYKELGDILDLAMGAATEIIAIVERRYPSGPIHM